MLTSSLTQALGVRVVMNWNVDRSETCVKIQRCVSRFSLVYMISV